jgi:hypothetical protein
MNSGKEFDRGIDIVIPHFCNIATIDPAQQRVPSLAIYAQDARDDIDAIVLHQAQSTGLRRKPVTRILATRRILLERKCTLAAAHAPDAAVATTGDERAHFDRPADKPACHFGRLREIMVERVQAAAPAKTCCSTSRQLGQTL